MLLNKGKVEQNTNPNHFLYRNANIQKSKYMQNVFNRIIKVVNNLPFENDTIYYSICR